MQENPPQQHRFSEPTIPAHVTYAFKKGATIVENKQFYRLPKGFKSQIQKVDILFLIANAPVATASLPERGSQSYVGLATEMELAMQTLVEKFPIFFGEQGEEKSREKAPANIDQSKK